MAGQRFDPPLADSAGMERREKEKERSNLHVATRRTLPALRGRRGKKLYVVLDVKSDVGLQGENATDDDERMGGRIFPEATGSLDEWLRFVV